MPSNTHPHTHTHTLAAAIIDSSGFTIVTVDTLVLSIPMVSPTAPTALRAVLPFPERDSAHHRETYGLHPRPGSPAVAQPNVNS